jgi:hypothetical protein
MKEATGLYYAVDKAIDMLNYANLPSSLDLSNVAVVTFTDGLDNVSIDLNPNYTSRSAYRAAVKNRIDTFKKNEIPVSAHSIGLRGPDVMTDPAEFKADLKAIASTPADDYVHEVTEIAQVYEKFQAIANSLRNDITSQNLTLTIPGGYDDETKIRFTFDVNDADAVKANDSSLFIEGIYRRSGDLRFLQDVKCRGLSIGGKLAVDIVYGERDPDMVGIYNFIFEDVSITSGVDGEPIKSTRQWEYITASTPQRWQINSEFDRKGVSSTEEEKKTAAIMLVLDCTTSLRDDNFDYFKIMKDSAKAFIKVLLGGYEGEPPKTLLDYYWTDGTLDTLTEEDKYSFNFVAGNIYRIWWNDSSAGDGTKTADIKVKVEVKVGIGAQDVMFSNRDKGWETPLTIIPNSSGTAIITVVRNSGNPGTPGTYGIVYSSASSTRP